ncbi:MAG: 3-methyl-2-oxobutanoate dehydrogenase subunit VorB [Bacillota bacterium]|nr:3-methyl-2-oxobutanoate dehydrogenase subunit VorB [Bacillota bacterium]
MSEKELLKGNIALARGALDAGCRYYFGYPITPQNDIPEYMSASLPALGGVFVQAESELAAINMVLGASAAGGAVMTSSSGPGISLMQEGLSYLAGSELPAVVVNITRSGPGLGGIAPTQGDYFQATRGGGHGDYRLAVLAPSSVQEMYDLTGEAFRLAFRYRNPVMILGDAILGQMKEPVTVKPAVAPEEDKSWALSGADGRLPHLVKSLYLDDGEMTAHNWKLDQKYTRLKEEARVEVDCPPGCSLVLIAFGSCSRIVRTAVDRARKRGLPVGLIRPVTLFPFPEKEIGRAVSAAGRGLVIEMNTGQMVDDARLACKGEGVVYFKGYPGGTVPTPEQIEQVIDEAINWRGAAECQL